jgi:predicted DCC family thiol-disulfide oxidoreductase YuxK
MNAWPTIVYDDDCGFCTWSARYAAARGPFALVGFSELTDEQLARLPPDYESCAHLFVGGETYSCGAAAEEIVARMDSPEQLPMAAFQLLPEGVRTAIREPVYRTIANNRDALGTVRRCEPPARGG